MTALREHHIENSSARFYQETVRAIDRPGEPEANTRPADGERLFAPKQLMLQAGQAEYYKVLLPWHTG